MCRGLAVQCGWYDLPSPYQLIQRAALEWILAAGACSGGGRGGRENSHLCVCACVRVYVEEPTSCSLNPKCLSTCCSNCPTNPNQIRGANKMKTTVTCMPTHIAKMAVLHSPCRLSVALVPALSHTETTDSYGRATLTVERPWLATGGGAE